LVQETGRALGRGLILDLLQEGAGVTEQHVTENVAALKLRSGRDRVGGGRTGSRGRRLRVAPSGAVFGPGGRSTPLRRRVLGGGCLLVVLAAGEPETQADRQTHEGLTTSTEAGSGG